MRRLLILAILLLGTPALAQDGEMWLGFDPVTTFADGEPLPDGVVVTYVVYWDFDSGHPYANQVEKGTTTPKLTALPCRRICAAVKAKISDGETSSVSENYATTPTGERELCGWPTVTVVDGPFVGGTRDKCWAAKPVAEPTGLGRADTAGG